VILHLLEIEPALRALNGGVMELEDCAFPLLQGIVPTASLAKGFKGANCLIALNNAKSVPADRWFAMTMLDQNRASTQLAKKAVVDISAASAANAVVGTVRRLTTPTPAGDYFSVGVQSDGAYGIEKGLIYSFPIRSDGENWSVVPCLPVNDFSRSKLTATENELKEEKALVATLLPQ